MLARFEICTGVMWNTADGRYGHGIVIGSDENSVKVVRVLPLEQGIHCYDEGINYETDKDNVRLDCCPPPFSLLHILNGVEKCYAVATMDDPIVFEANEFKFLETLEDGAEVSESTYDKLFRHDWPMQPQKQKTIVAEMNKADANPKVGAPTAKMFAMAAEKMANRGPGHNGNGGLGL